MCAAAAAAAAREPAAAAAACGPDAGAAAAAARGSDAAAAAAQQLAAVEADLRAYQEQHPHVAGLSRLLSRVRADQRAAQQAGGVATHQAAELSAAVQGALNNARGFAGELAALREAPGVIGVGSKMRGRSQAGLELVVEVDVVADRGLSWVEVKSQAPFGVASGHFTGSKGLQEQVARLLAVAASPQYQRRGLTPQVIVFFPSGEVGDGVAAALEAAGAKVAAGPGSLARLCGVAPLAAITNLDVTALCALVSQVSWQDPHSAALQAWAARTVHWRDCLAAEQRSPLLPEIAPTLLGPGRRLVASCAAVAQFELLLGQFGGPREQHRWQELLAQLLVLHCSWEHGELQLGGGGGGRCSACGADLRPEARVSADSVVAAGQPEQQPEQQQQQAAAGDLQQLLSGQRPLGAGPASDGAWVAVSHSLCLQKQLTPLQLAVLGQGDSLGAVTLTANGSTARSVAAAGVVLDVHVHRPVWLTGL